MAKSSNETVLRKIFIDDPSVKYVKKKKKKNPMQW